MPVFFLQPGDQIRDGVVRITSSLIPHLQGSLRVQAGDRLMVAMPPSRRYDVEVLHVDRRLLSGRILAEIPAPPRRSPRVVLAQAILKGERMDWLIQKAVELGAARIVPLVCSQGVVRPRADRISAQQDRWQRIALEAAQQSEGWEVPEVGSPISGEKFFAAGRAGALGCLLTERRAGAGLATVSLPADPAGTIIVAVGPEGGWRNEEVDQALACGYVGVTLGARILRAETAGLAALALVQSRLGELG